jgi:hypothetical protein
MQSTREGIGHEFGIMLTSGPSIKLDGRFTPKICSTQAQLSVRIAEPSGADSACKSPNAIVNWITHYFPRSLPWLTV